MKKIICQTVALLSALSVPLFADEPNRTTEQFFGVKRNNGYTQALLGSSEVLIGSILAHSAFKTSATRPGSLLPTDTANATTNAMNSARNTKEHLKILRSFNRSRPGLISSIKVLGSAILFTDAAGRLYEWYSTDAEPTWSPVYSYMANESGVALSDIPSDPILDSEFTAPEGPTFQPSQDFSSARRELEQKLQDRIAKINPSFKASTEEALGKLNSTEASELASYAATLTSHNEKVEADRQAHAAKVEESRNAQRGKIPPFTSQDFFKSRPTDDSAQFAQQVLFGGDVLGTTLLVRSLFNRETAKMVLAAEESARATQNLLEAGNLGAAQKAILAQKQALLTATELELAKTSLQGEALANLKKELRALRAEVSAMEASASVVSPRLKPTLEKLAASDLAKVRKEALRTSRGGKLFAGLKIVGTGLLIMDAAGRVYQWNANDPDPKFSPAMTWMIVNSKEPMEKVFEKIAPYLDDAEADFKEIFRRVGQGVPEMRSNR